MFSLAANYESTLTKCHIAGIAIWWFGWRWDSTVLSGWTWLSVTLSHSPGSWEGYLWNIGGYVWEKNRADFIFFIFFSGKQVKSTSKSLQVNFMCIYIFFFKLTVHSHFLDAWSQSHNWVMGTHSSWLSCFLCGQLPLCSFQRCFKIVYEISICRHFTGND